MNKEMASTPVAAEIGYNEPDDMLEMLVSLANNAGLGAGVTLNVGGSLVTGTLVGGKVWFDQVADLLVAEEDNAEVRGALADGFRTRGATYRDTLVPRNDDDELDDTLVAYIHLADAAIYQGETTHRVGLWRGRLVAVDGWTLGRGSR